MDLRNITNDLPRHPLKAPVRRPVSQITHIAIHHSTGDARRITVQGIARYHVAEPPNGNGWPAIGYHFVIDADGVVYETNSLETVGTHVAGHNLVTVGVCLLGEFTKGREPPDAQRRALAELLAWLCPLVSVPLERVWGHKSFSGQNTTCPGDTWEEWGLRTIDEARTLLENAPRMWAESELRALIHRVREGQ